MNNVSEFVERVLGLMTVLSVDMPSDERADMYLQLVEGFDEFADEFRTAS